MNAALRDLQTLFDVGSLVGLSDGQLLDRYVARREEAVFETIVRRHGPMVGDDFVICNNSRGARQRRTESEVAKMADFSVNDQVPEDELLLVLYEEIKRLPDEYRLAVVYCHLEEMTHAQAARELGWTEGMVRGRVAKARSALRRNLARRGLVLSAAALAAALSGPSTCAVLAALALGWMDGKVKAATEIPAGGVPYGMVSAAFLKIVRAALRSMMHPCVLLVAAASATHFRRPLRKFFASLRSRKSSSGNDRNRLWDSSTVVDRGTSTSSGPVRAEPTNGGRARVLGDEPLELVNSFEPFSFEPLNDFGGSP